MPVYSLLRPPSDAFPCVVSAAHGQRCAQGDGQPDDGSQQSAAHPDDVTRHGEDQVEDGPEQDGVQRASGRGVRRHEAHAVEGHYDAAESFHQLVHVRAGRCDHQRRGVLREHEEERAGQQVEALVAALRKRAPVIKDDVVMRGPMEAALAMVSELA
jgi:hypothetical protein